MLVAAFLVLGLLLHRRRRLGTRRKNLGLNRSLQDLIGQDQFEYYLVDVRSEGEFRKGHIPTAVNVPFGKLNTFLPTDNLFINIVVYGRSLRQSAKAAAILGDSGYFNVTSFGPMFKWRGPVSRGAGEEKTSETE